MGQYESLKHVAFAVQMLGKSFRLLPGMAWGLLISEKEYGVIDWSIAVAVSLGVAEFLLTGNISSPGTQGNCVYGLLLLVGFLVCNGFGPVAQEKLFKEYNASKYNQMLYVNLCS